MMRNTLPPLASNDLLGVIRNLALERVCREWPRFANLIQGGVRPIQIWRVEAPKSDKALQRFQNTAALYRNGRLKSHHISVQHFRRKFFRLLRIQVARRRYR